MSRKILSLALSFMLLFSQTGLAQVATELNLAAYLGRLTYSPADKLRLPCLRYFSYDNLNNSFKIILDKGDFKEIKGPKLTDSAQELLKYFLIGITLPNESFWVNLRPDSPDNIIDDFLAQTDVGRILLEADLQLKKDTAEFTSPQTAEGKLYWDKLYQKAGELFGSQDVNIPTLTRPWIVPGEVIIRETQDSAYIYKATLKIMLEEDYLKGDSPLRGQSPYVFSDPRLKALNEYSSQLIRELIIPKLTKEVNISKRYANLRQVYYSIILARWFKSRFYGKGGVYSWAIDKRNLNGLTSEGQWSKSTYFKEYKSSFEKGQYNLQVPVAGQYGQNIRSYFSGGIDVTAASPITGGSRVSTKAPNFTNFLSGNPTLAILGGKAGANLANLSLDGVSLVEVEQATAIPRAATEIQLGARDSLADENEGSVSSPVKIPTAQETGIEFIYYSLEVYPLSLSGLGYRVADDEQRALLSSDADLVKQIPYSARDSLIIVSQEALRQSGLSDDAGKRVFVLGIPSGAGDNQKLEIIAAKLREIKSASSPVEWEVKVDLLGQSIPSAQQVISSIEQIIKGLLLNKEDSNGKNFTVTVGGRIKYSFTIKWTGETPSVEEVSIYYFKDKRTVKANVTIQQAGSPVSVKITHTEVFTADAALGLVEADITKIKRILQKDVVADIEKQLKLFGGTTFRDDDLNMIGELAGRRLSYNVTFDEEQPNKGTGTILIESKGNWYAACKFSFEVAGTAAASSPATYVTESDIKNLENEFAEKNSVNMKTRADTVTRDEWIELLNKVNDARTVINQEISQQVIEASEAEGAGLVPQAVDKKLLSFERRLLTLRDKIEVTLRSISLVQEDASSKGAGSPVEWAIAKLSFEPGDDFKNGNDFKNIDAELISQIERLAREVVEQLLSQGVPSIKAAQSDVKGMQVYYHCSIEELEGVPAVVFFDLYYGSKYSKYLGEVNIGLKEKTAIIDGGQAQSAGSPVASADAEAARVARLIHNALIKKSPPSIDLLKREIQGLFQKRESLAELEKVTATTGDLELFFIRGREGSYFVRYQRPDDSQAFAVQFPDETKAASSPVSKKIDAKKLSLMVRSITQWANEINTLSAQHPQPAAMSGVARYFLQVTFHDIESATSGSEIDVDVRFDSSYKAHYVTRYNIQIYRDFDAEVFIEKLLGMFENTPNYAPFHTVLPEAQIIPYVKALKARLEEMGKDEGAGSPLENTVALPLGGIDLRNILLIVQPIGNFSNLKFAPPASSPVLQKMNLDEEFKQLSSMVEKGILPSAQRVKEFIFACCYKKELSQRLGDLIPLLTSLCRLQEECACESEPELKESLMLVEAVGASAATP